MNKEEKDIGKIMEEMLNRPLDLIEENKKLKKKIEKLQKENKKYIDIFNSTEKIMNGQERTKDKLLKENVELQKENEELKVDNKKLNDLLMFSELDYISKDIIRNKIKELEEKDKTSSTNIYGYGIKFLKELLGE